MIALQVIIAFFILSWFSAQLARVLDFSMDYGHIFDFVRIRVANREAERLGLSDWLTENMIKIQDMTRGEAIDHVDEVYQRLAIYSKKMGLYSCVYCIGLRVAVFLSIIAGCILAYYLSAWFLLLIPTVPVLTFSILDL